MWYNNSYWTRICLFYKYMNNEKLDSLEELIWRWKNHYKMLNDIHKSNMDKTKLEKWKNQIDQCFNEKIKSKL